MVVAQKYLQADENQSFWIILDKSVRSLIILQPQAATKQRHKQRGVENAFDTEPLPFVKRTKGQNKWCQGPFVESDEFERSRE
jgi:hypothetical protein